jgi:riboflavin kinase/FMN adenylyltransferase
MATRVHRTLQDIVCQRSSLNTVGTFDGVHRGHQTILDELRREAEECGASTTVVTFSPHPQVVLRNPGRPPVKTLTTDDEKIASFETAKIDRVVVIPFTIEFSRTPSEQFVRDILFERIGMSGVVLGHDHGFGRNREGDFALMARLGTELGFTVRELPPFEQDGMVVSSTRIRELLSHGEVDKAMRLLGRPYQFAAKVVRGDGRGRQIGFPTANLEIDDSNKLIPLHGVYAVRVQAGARALAGMMNIGTRPTFGKSGESIEVHILDFADDLYGTTLTVKFIQRLRSEQTFDSAAALVAQLKLDREAAKLAIAGNN